MTQTSRIQSQTSSLPHLFLSKKAQILELLAIPDDEYTDKSPKGSVDAPIIDLIREINKIDGLVTTSSCSGRVSVFVEGGGNRFPGAEEDGGDDMDGVDGSLQDTEDDVRNEAKKERKKKKKVRGGPSGKGGGRWLYVSHDPVDLTSTTTTSTSSEPAATVFSSTSLLTSDDNSTRQQQNGKEQGYFTRLCGLSRPSATQSLPSSHTTKTQETTTTTTITTKPGQIPRLIHLSFSPLILHVLTANLASHARPLLSAAINAGFRESGVQSLSALSHHPQSQSNPDQSHPQPSSSGPGTMVAIRTAGLTFDTVIGIVKYSHDSESGTEIETMEAIVSEEYLAMCFDVVNERFRWNEGRKERLRTEIREAFFGRAEKLERLDWEDKEDRRRRKREEGLRRKEEIERLKEMERNETVGISNGDSSSVAGENAVLDDILDLKIN